MASGTSESKHTVWIGDPLVLALSNCIKDAIDRQHIAHANEDIIDIRVHYQKWKDKACGFPSRDPQPGVFLAPCFVLKFDPRTRYIYHNGYFAYVLIGSPTMQYYDGVRLRSLPGQVDWKNAMLVENYRPLGKEPGI